MTITSTRACPPMAPLAADLPDFPDYRWIHVTWTVSLPSPAAT